MLVKAGRETGIMVDVEGEGHFYNGISMLLDGHSNLEHNLPVAHYYDDVIQLMSHATSSNTPNRARAPAAVEIRGEEHRRALADRMRELEIPAVAIAVFDHYELQWSKAYGLADAEGQDAAGDTVFLAGSISKSVNALAALQAVADGTLSPRRADQRRAADELEAPR